PLDDAGPQSGGDASAVALEAELVLQYPDDRLDALPQPVREVPGLLLVLAGRADEGQLHVIAGGELLGILPGQAPVRDDGGAGGGPVRGLAGEPCRACSRSPHSFGLARLNPVTVPSQVQITAACCPSTSASGSGSTRTRRIRTGPSGGR